MRLRPTCADPDSNRQRLEALGAVYKQLDAPFGAFALDLLAASTRALSADDASYSTIEAAIANLTSQRDALAAQIRTALNAAAFADTKVTAKQAKDFMRRVLDLLDQSANLTIP